MHTAALVKNVLDIDEEEIARLAAGGVIFGAEPGAGA
jgi:hypothetical protein